MTWPIDSTPRGAAVVEADATLTEEDASAPSLVAGGGMAVLCGTTPPQEGSKTFDERKWLFLWTIVRNV